MIIEDFTLGERIMVYRKRTGLTKAEFAKMTHVSVSTLGKYEADLVENPDIDILNNFSIILSVSVNKLIMGIEDPNKRMALESLIKS